MQQVIESFVIDFAPLGFNNNGVAATDKILLQARDISI
jgi:hypothetical protein